MILVTGATGPVGTQLVKEPLAANVPFRALVRDPERAADLLGPGVALAQGDYEQPHALEAALIGVERLFLVSPLVT